MPVNNKQNGSGSGILKKLKNLFGMNIGTMLFGVLFIYAFNVIVFPINTTISINIFTILIVSIFGLPGIIGICLFSIFVL